MATRKDVAQRANVSEAVVSYVVNDSNYVKVETRERVEKAIKELNYRPNLLARSLKTDRSHQLAFICNDFNNPFFSQMASHVTKVAFENGYLLSVNDVGYNDERIDLIFQYQVDGIVICSDVFTSEEINGIIDKGIAVVLFANRIYENLDERVAIVNPDIYFGMTQLMEHLIERGHTRFSFISSAHFQDQESENLRYRSFMDKLGGYETQSYHIDTVSSVEQIEISLDSIMADNSKSAIVCGNDAIAFHVLNILKKRGISVPDEIAVSGFDNVNYVDLMSPRLTTVNLDIEKISLSAIDLLLKNLRKEEWTSIEWQCTLKIGETT